MSFKQQDLLSKKTLKLSKMLDKDYKDLGIEKDDTKGNDAFIHNFVEICWIDPFATDNEAAMEKSMSYIEEMSEEGKGK